MHSLVEKVKGVGQSTNDFFARMILTLLYFVLLAPIAFWQRWRQKPSTQPAQGAESFWSVREPDNSTLEDARRAY